MKLYSFSYTSANRTGLQLWKTVFSLNCASIILLVNSCVPNGSVQSAQSASGHLISLPLCVSLIFFSHGLHKIARQFAHSWSYNGILLQLEHYKQLSMMTKAWSNPFISFGLKYSYLHFSSSISIWFFDTWRSILASMARSRSVSLFIVNFVIFYF